MPAIKWDDAELKQVQGLVLEKIKRIEKEKTEYLIEYKILGKLLQNIDIDYKAFAPERRARIYAEQVTKLADKTGLSEAAIRKGKLQ